MPDNHELDLAIAEILGYIEGAFGGKTDQFSKTLIERANRLARAAKQPEVREGIAA